MMKILSTLLFGLVLPCLQLSIVNYQLSIANAATIGTWKAYMAYHDIKEVEQGAGMMFVLASDNLYTYNQNDHSIQTYDKTNGLSDCGIDHIAWNNTAKRLVIVYKNYNIDLMDDRGEVVNMSDYSTKTMTVDKTINSIDMSGNYAYLSTGFGLIKLNVRDAEISDTYNLGFRVDYSYIEGNYLYAASSAEGLYRGLTTNNLLDKNNWERVGDYASRNKTTDSDLLAIAETLKPGGPKYNVFHEMKLKNNRLYTCAGLYAPTVDTNHIGTVQVLDNDEWIICEDDLTSRLGYSYVDVNTIAVDPKNENHIFAGARCGMFEFLDGKFIKAYTYGDGELKSTFGVSEENPYGNDHNYVIVNGLEFDNEGNLWILQAMNTNNLLMMSKDGTWKNLYQEKLLNGYYPRNLFVDSRGLLWFVNSHWSTPSANCYDIANNKFYSYSNFINEDGTTVNAGIVKYVTEDKNKNIWIGTEGGPLIFEPSEFTSDNPVFIQVKVPRNDGTNYADYLLDGVDITAIAIDGAGRKWFGTNGNGVFLISEDNYTQIHHFTSENSKLLSDVIESIAINDNTGEVFFGTSNGLCSYMSDAVKPNESMNKNNVWAYPNPVRPDYTGPITITGLSYDADIKIVTTNGVLVAKGRSTGGIFTWDGTDLKGKRVASGVYMVETATKYGEKGTVCKIAIVN